MPKGLGAQIVAGILGLLFVVGLVLLGRRLGQDLKSRFFNAAEQTQAEVTPTPTQSPLAQGEQDTQDAQGDPLLKEHGDIDGNGAQTSIPATGAGSLLLTTLLIPAGYYLRKQTSA